MALTMLSTGVLPREEAFNALVTVLESRPTQPPPGQSGSFGLDHGTAMAKADASHRESARDRFYSRAKLRRFRGPDLSVQWTAKHASHPVRGSYHRRRRQLRRRKLLRDRLGR